MKALCHTFGNTCRFKSLINPVDTIIAFDDLTRFRIPLGCSPGTGRYAALATDAEGLINENNAVFGSFLHRASGAGGDTPGIFAMKTGKEHIGHARQIIQGLGSNLYYLAESRSRGKAFIYLAVGFTTKASNTTFSILVYEIFAH
jgi:hypothetical protein